MLSFEPHVFSEVWTSHMDFFVEQCLTDTQAFAILQMLVTHQSVSQQLVGIMLKYLMDNLTAVGDYNPKRANLTLRLFKIAFLAINNFIADNETVLVPHLQKLILDSFSYAAKAKDQATYYQILRALFR